jgi:hypothetical protein
MALATFDIVAILRRELPEYGVPAATLSSLAGISSGKLSAYLNGIARCPNEHELRLRTTWAQIKKLVTHADPLPLNFTRADILRKCIDLMESGVLKVVVFEQKESEEKE